MRVTSLDMMRLRPLIFGEANPPTLTTVVIVVAIGATLIIAGATSFGLALIGIFGVVSAIELFFSRST